MEKDYYRLGIECYEEDDIDGAIAMFEKGAIEDDVNCLYELGCYYQYDLGEAIKYYQKAASIGHVFSRLALLKIYNSGTKLAFVKENVQQWFLQAKEIDNFENQQLTAFCYWNGIGTKKDHIKSIEVQKDIAIGGSEDEAWKLYHIYKQGIEVKADYSEALKWCDVAAHLGHSEAQYEMGKIHEDVKDYKTAVFYYEQASEQGHPEAMCRLGFCYGRGLGVEKNKEKGIQLLQQSGVYPTIYAPGFEIDFGEE